MSVDVPVDKQEIGDVPHIEVKVKYKGEEVSQYCAHFIDAISFLCQAEAALRRGLKMQQPVDFDTTKIQQANMAKLLGETK